MNAPEPAGPKADDLLQQTELPIPGLYRRHLEHNLGAVAAAMDGAYLGTGPVRLGPDRSLVVIIGVQYLHADGRRTVNCHDGRTDDPNGPGPVRPTRTPALRTVFDDLAGAGVPSVMLLNELAALDHDVLGRLTHGARIGSGSPLPAAAAL